MDEDDRPNDKGPPHGPGPATPLEIPGLGSIPPIGALPNPLGRLPADAIAQGLGITGIAAQSPGIGLPFPPVSPQAAPQGIFGHPIGNPAAPLGAALPIHPGNPGATGPGIQIGSIAGQLGSLLPFSAAPTPGGMPGAAPAAGDKDDPPPS
ncbi:MULTISPECIES: hypothetical protein [unclassified Sphingomonas]|uniref:hypothetical protein n=1 Tax=Sphingomonas TaxID=13687 RepID=UPI00095EC1DF|nr:MULTISPECIES: hypothetical protein [unclassified Sphingomonas]MBN8812445.1 hypothetical protein [Sphingomonas sp.]OJY52225.1 MAG: hypothetical protein BGP17_15550 [Sphingomonas sp. 67-41]